MESPAPAAPNLFEYLDYRNFIRDRMEAMKREHAALSQRYLAAKAGVDPGTLSRIVRGERNLDPRLAGSLGLALGLRGEQSAYFETLVLYCQARSKTEKNQYYERLLRLAGSKVTTLREHQFRYYGKWYHVAIRELLNVYRFDGDYQKLARKLRPAISAAEARAAVKLLLETGLVEITPEGEYRLTEKLISSGEGIDPVLADNFHANMGDLAVQGLHEIASPQRDFSALTLSLSQEAFQSICEKLARFRREVLEVARRAGEADQVFQLNFQFFPVSHRDPEKPA